MQPFYIRTGLLWQSEELPALERFLAAIATSGLTKLVVLELPLGDLYGGHWSLTGQNIPPADSPDEAVFLPGRNASLIVKAAVWCQLHGIRELAMAPLGTSPFEDASAAFARDFQAAINHGGMQALRLVAPIWRDEQATRDGTGPGAAIGVNVLVVSRRAAAGTAGACNKCAERQAAFREAKMEDRTEYAE